MAVISRPTARPWTNRAPTSTHIEVAAEPMSRPAMNSARPTSSGRRAPCWSEYIPDTTMPTTLVTRKPVNAQP
jgi:hypothetical protein